MKEIEVNVAYRWFLRLDMMDPVPHFSTFGKNYTRRFKDTDLFEQIFSRILEECMKYKLVDTNQIFVDSTHVKSCANSKKIMRKVTHEQALWYEDELKKEIEQDRLAHGKKPLKDKNNHQPPTSGGNGFGILENAEEIPDGAKTQKAAQVIQKAAGPEKGDISMFLLIQSKPHVIRMDGFWDIAFTLEMNMTAERLRHYMRK